MHPKIFKLTKLFFITAFIIAVILLARKPALANATPTAIPTEKTKMIDDIKNRLATKVAELRQSEKRAMFGAVRVVSPASFTLALKEKEIKIDLTDEIKVLQIIGGRRTTLTNDNIDKGDLVTVFGDYDTTLDLLKAKIIFIQSAPPVFIHGTVANINKSDFSFTLTTELNQTLTIDIDPPTKIIMWTKDKGQGLSGFSKMNPGDIVHVLGKPAANKDNRYHALRILDLGNLANPTPTAAPSISATPSASAKISPTP